MARASGNPRTLIHHLQRQQLFSERNIPKIMAALRERIYLLDETYAQYAIGDTEYTDVREQLYIEKAADGTSFHVIVDISSAYHEFVGIKRTITTQDARTISEFFGTVSKI